MDVNIVMDGKDVVLIVNYLLVIGNFYIVIYCIFFLGVVKVDFIFIFIDMEVVKIEVLEVILMVIFIFGSDVVCKVVFKLEVFCIGVCFCLFVEMN